MKVYFCLFVYVLCVFNLWQDYVEVLQRKYILNLTFIYFCSKGIILAGCLWYSLLKCSGTCRSTPSTFSPRSSFQRLSGKSSSNCVFLPKSCSYNKYRLKIRKYFKIYIVFCSCEVFTSMKETHHHQQQNKAFYIKVT